MFPAERALYMDPRRGPGPVERAPTPSERNQFAVTYNGLGVAGLLPTAPPRRPAAAHRDRSGGGATDRASCGRRCVELGGRDRPQRVIDACLDVVERRRAYWTNHVAVKRWARESLASWPCLHMASWPHGLNACVP